MSPDPGTVTQLLNAAGHGDAAARDRLWAVLYNELTQMAQRQLARESPAAARQATSLVHDLFIRLTAGQQVDFENRRHFFGSAARAMRQILVEDARKRTAEKRGGGKRPQELHDVPANPPHDPAELLAVDEALKKLEKIDPRRAEIVTLRYFAGLTGDEIAALLDLASRTIDAEWQSTRAWLHRELFP